MSDANSENDVDDELKNALLAAFGEDGIDLLDDDDDFEEMPEELLEAAHSTDSSSESMESALDSISKVFDELDNEDDSPRTKWIKQVSKAIFANDLSALSNGDHLNSDSASQLDRYVLFAIGEQQFGVPLSEVWEISRYPKVTELPRTSSWLRGVTNFRGQILSVTDLRNLFELPHDRPVLGEKIIVVGNRQSDFSTALVVDRVLGIRKLTDRQANSSKTSSAIASFANGVAKLENHQIVLINPDQILACAEQIQAPA